MGREDPRKLAEAPRAEANYIKRIIEGMETTAHRHDRLDRLVSILFLSSKNFDVSRWQSATCFRQHNQALQGQIHDRHVRKACTMNPNVDAWHGSFLNAGPSFMTCFVTSLQYLLSRPAPIYFSRPVSVAPLTTSSKTSWDLRHSRLVLRTQDHHGLLFEKFPARPPQDLVSLELLSRPSQDLLL